MLLNMIKLLIKYINVSGHDPQNLGMFINNAKVPSVSEEIHVCMYVCMYL